MTASCVNAATVRLDLPASSRDEAVDATAGLLRGDPRLVSWEEFRAAIGERQVVELGGVGSCAVCLAHGRGAGVADLALSAVRLAVPVDGGEGRRIGMVFVFAIPLTMAEEYLRAVGALARVCGNAKQCGALLAAETVEEFAGLLAKWIA